MLFLHHVHVLSSAKVVVFLQQNSIILVFVEVKDGLEILLIKVFVLEFLDYDVSFFCFSEAHKKNIKIMLNLLSSF